MRTGYQGRRLIDAARAIRLARRWEARDSWSREQLLAYQSARLRRLLAHAVSASPFYRESLGQLPRGVETPLEGLPTLDKATMMERWDELVTDPRLRLADVQRQIERMRGDDLYLGEYRICATAGSTGERGIFAWSRREWSTVLVGVLRWSALMGVRPSLRHRVRFAAIGAGSPIHQTNLMSSTMDVGLMRLLRLEATAPIADLVEELNAFKPEALHAYPSIAALLALEQLEGRLRIAPRVVSTSSEVRTAEMEERIAAAWGVRPFDCYGMTEVGIFGSDDEWHRGIHAFEDLFILEVVGEDNQPVPDGVSGHRVLITNLHNYTQPLIRYEVSDLLTPSAERCPCGRPYRLIRAVEGRSDEILELPGARGGTVRVHPLHLRSPMAAIGEVGQYQFVQRGDRLHLYVALRSGAGEEAAKDRIQAALTAKLDALDLPGGLLELHVVDQIERAANQAAKFKLVSAEQPPARMPIADPGPWK